MPIEIRELHIKVNVSSTGSTNKSTGDSSIQKEEIIAECVEQVMEIMKDKKGR